MPARSDGRVTDLDGASLAGSRVAEDNRPDWRPPRGAGTQLTQCRDQMTVIGDIAGATAAQGPDVYLNAMPAGAERDRAAGRRPNHAVVESQRAVGRDVEPELLDSVVAIYREETRRPAG